MGCSRPCLAASLSQAKLVHREPLSLASWWLAGNEGGSHFRGARLPLARTCAHLPCRAVLRRRLHTSSSDLSGGSAAGPSGGGTRAQDRRRQQRWCMPAGPAHTRATALAHRADGAPSGGARVRGWRGLERQRAHVQDRGDHSGSARLRGHLIRHG